MSGKANVVNLNRFRKRKAREAAEKTAQANRRKHGRSKAEREAERQKRERAARQLEHHRLFPGDPDESDR